VKFDMTQCMMTSSSHQVRKFDSRVFFSVSNGTKISPKIRPGNTRVIIKEVKWHVSMDYGHGTEL